MSLLSDIASHSEPVCAKERDTMPVAGNDTGRSFDVLEMSLSANLKDLAMFIANSDNEQERQRHRLLACRIVSEKFRAFTPEEVMDVIWGHLYQLDYDQVAQELCDYADAAKQLLDEQKLQVHQLRTDLAQAKLDAEHYQLKVNHLTAAHEKLLRKWRATMSTGPTQDYVCPIRDIPATGTSCESCTKTWIVPKSQGRKNDARQLSLPFMKRGRK